MRAVCRSWQRDDLIVLVIPSCRASHGFLFRVPALAEARTAVDHNRRANWTSAETKDLQPNRASRCRPPLRLAASRAGPAPARVGLYFVPGGAYAQAWPVCARPSASVPAPARRCRCEGCTDRVRPGADLLHLSCTSSCSTAVVILFTSCPGTSTPALRRSASGMPAHSSVSASKAPCVPNVGRDCHM